MIRQGSLLTKQVKDYAIRGGCDLVGIADPIALHESPDGHPSPFRILPGARSVIVFAKSFPHGAVESPHPPADGSIEEIESIHAGVYVSTYWSLNSSLMDVAVNLAGYLERAGYISAPIHPTLGRDETTWIGCISMRRSAEEAGLGDIGPSQNLITEEYGPRVRLGAVLSTAPLEVDGPNLRGQICKNCVRCASAPKCPVGAINSSVGDFDRKRCLWGGMGLHKATGGLQPPDEWMQAASAAEMMKLIPTYAERFPLVDFYRKLSAKFNGYPSCQECYVHCAQGKRASRAMSKLST